MPVNPTSVKTLDADCGSYQLTRYPLNAPETLQAWDAADRQLITAVNEYIESHSLTAPVIWVLNDAFGAITTALHQHHPVLISDSFSAHQACRENYSLNKLSLDESQLVSSLELSNPDFSANKPDIVLFKIPKTLAFWEYQLRELKQHLTPDTYLLGGSMVKHLSKSMIEKMSQLLGTTQPSLAAQKARLIRCEVDFDTQAPKPAKASPKASGDIKTYDVPEYKLSLANHPNLFSRDRLDIGTRFFLENFPKLKPTTPDTTIVDMACGNGILGIVAGQRCPQASIVFTDESYMAIASAKVNVEKYLPEQETAFSVTDCLTGIDNQSANIILSNPPFHQQHVVGDFIARQMFKDAHRVLKTDGELWVIANRQLGYHVKLKQLFGNCETVKGNPKFVILKAVKNAK